MNKINFDEHYFKESGITSDKRIFNSGKIANFDPLLILKTYIQKDKGMKPVGLWYGFGTSWIEWCHSEMPEWIGDENFEVVGVDSLNILKMSTLEELLDFTKKYKKSRFDTLYIDWIKLANDYDGIEITPYLWDARLNDETEWYYGWDCASGCVWKSQNLKLIKIDTNNE